MVPSRSETAVMTAIQMLAVYAASFSIAFIAFVPFRVVVVSTTAGPGFAGSTQQFLLWFVVATVLAVLAVRYVKGKYFWILFFGVGAAAGLYSVTLVFAQRITTGGAAQAIAIVVPLVLVLGRLRFKRVWVHNVVVLLTAIGVAGLFAWQFQPDTLVAALVVLAVYDVLAVYATKHMVSMATQLFSREALFGLIVPHRLRGWLDSYQSVNPGTNAMVLGAGDLVLPLMLALSHGIHTEPGAFWIIASAALVGVVLLQLMFTLLAKGRAIPALPPLVVAVLIGHFIVQAL